MCGIAGILGRLDDANRAALRRMSDALAHRGPDGHGAYESPPDAAGHGCLLAHRRLSILDLSDCAAQPMRDAATGRHVITFNGEIYNYADLRAGLQADGHGFASTGDTAVLLRLLASRGYDAARHLRGMYAFAVWDEVLRQLVVARDPLGIKPLYVGRNPAPDADRTWTFVFASEVRAVLASSLLGRPALCPAAVRGFVWNGFVPGPGTIVQGVESLWPGEVRTLDAVGRTLGSDTSWSLPDAGPDGHDGNGDSAAADDDAERRAREAIAESVGRHLVSDVPVGVFLSAGIDSSAVAHLARRAAAGPVHTFTLAFEEEAYNEGHHARRIAGAIGSAHTESVLTQGDFAGGIDRALDSLDQPTFDGLNSWYISRAVRAAGIKVALVGTGGDELFGGYRSFRNLPRLVRVAGRAAWVPGFAKVGAARVVAAVARAAASRAGSGLRPQTRWAKLPDMVGDADDPIALYQHAYSLFLPGFQDELLADGGGGGPGAPFRGLPRATYDRLAAETRGRPLLQALSHLEFRQFLGQRLLRDTDAASMAHGLEVRLPLVDTAVVDAVSRVPVPRRYEPLGRKALLRRAGLAGLDPALFDRPKTGFVMPFDRWLRSSLGGPVDAVLRDAAAVRAVGLNPAAVARLWHAFGHASAGVYWSRVWAIYVLVRWCHRHGVLS